MAKIKQFGDSSKQKGNYSVVYVVKKGNYSNEPPVSLVLSSGLLNISFTRLTASS